MSETRVVLCGPDDGVVRIRFESDAGIQILSESVCQELGRILKSFDDEPPRILVFEATGRTFLAGASLHELKALDRRSARRYSRRGQKLFRRIAELPSITIAAIHAPCAGGGCELSLACDFRFLAESARIGLPEVTLGLIPGWGGAARAIRQLGPAAARRMILSGELLPAAEALRIGLADAVYADAEFGVSVDARIATFKRCAPQAVGAVKRFLAEGHHLDLADLMAEESRLFGRCYATSEPPEGIAAFLEKRSPKWPAGDEPPVEEAAADSTNPPTSE